MTVHVNRHINFMYDCSLTHKLVVISPLSVSWLLRSQGYLIIICLSGLMYPAQRTAFLRI